MNNFKRHISTKTRSAGFRGFFLFLLVLTAVMLTASCKKERSEDRVIATINGEQALESEFKLFQKVHALKSVDGAADSAIKTELFNRFIERKIVLGEAKKKKITATEAEISAAFRDFDGGVTGKGFPEVLKRRGISVEDWQKYSVDQVVFEKALSGFAEVAAPVKSVSASCLSSK